MARLRGKITSDTPESRADRRRLGFFAVLGALVVIGALWFSGGAAQKPTVTFDGITATYAGPTTIGAGVATFTTDTSSYDLDVALVIFEITDDSITMAGLESAAEQYPASSMPPFVGEVDTFVIGSEIGVTERSVFLRSETRYGVSIHTSGADTDRVYPATILEVD